MSGTSRNVFILVHGTWGRNSEWTKPGSAFQTLLTNRAGGCEISRISWGGRNREGDRAQGVEQLKASIKEQLDLHPNANHFVVAHSHGGNVAATAAADPDISRHLAGLVCFNTPFLVTVQRNLLSLALALGFVGIFAVPLSFINQAAVEGIVRGDRGEWESFQQWIRISWPLLAVVYPVPVFLLLSLPWRHHKNRPRVVECPNIDCPVLCVRTAGDEAFAGLTVVEAVAELPNILLHPISVLAALIIVFALVMGGVITPMPFTQAQNGQALWLRGISSGLVSAVFYVNVLLMCTVAFVAVAASALRSVALGLGVRHLLRRMELDIRMIVSLVPVNARDVSFFDVRPATEAWRLLSHSSVYEDAAVIEAVWRWCERHSARVGRDDLSLAPAETSPMDH